MKLKRIFEFKYPRGPKPNATKPCPVWLHIRKDGRSWGIIAAYTSGPPEIKNMRVGDAVVKYEATDVRVLIDLVPTWSE